MPGDNLENNLQGMSPEKWKELKASFEANNKGNVCPHCGHCPMCGRPTHWPNITYPQVPVYPWNPIVYCQQSTGSGTHPSQVTNAA